MRQHRTILQFVTVILVMVVAAWSVQIYEAWQRRDDVLRQVEDSNKRLMQLLDKDLQHAFLGVDLLLQQAAYLSTHASDIDHELNPFEGEQFGKAIQLTAYVSALAIIDTEGAILQSTRSPAGGRAFSIPETVTLDVATFYQSPLKGPPARQETLIGKPMSFDGEARATLPVARPFYGPRGEQKGFLVAFVRLDVLNQTFNATRPLNSSLFLFRQDNHPLVSSYAAGSEEADLSRPLPELYDSISLVRRTRQGNDDTGTIQAYRNVQNWPFVLLLETTTEQVLTDWYDQTLTRVWVGIAATLTILVLASLFIAQLSRRTKAETELKKLSKAIEFNPAIVLITNPQGLIEYVNPKFEQISGYSATEMIGERPGKVKSGRKTPAEYQEMWKTISSGKVWFGEFLNRRKNGGEYWVSAAIAPIFDEKGTITNYVAVEEDITVMKANEAALHNQKQLVDLLHTVTVIANESNSPHDAFQNALAVICEYLGWLAGHIYQRPDDDSDRLVSSDLWYLKDSEKLADFRKITKQTSFIRGEGLPGRALETRRPIWIADVTQDNNFPRQPVAESIGIRGAMALPIVARGDVVAVMEFFSLERSSKGNADLQAALTHIGIQLGRVVERDSYSSKLKTSEERFATSQSFAAIGTWEWHIEPLKLYWSDGVAPLFGYEPGTLPATLKTFLGVIHPEDRSRTIKAIRACVRDGAAYDIEHRIVWPDGSIHWVRERGDTVRDSTGRALRMLGVVIDIDAMKAGETALAHAKEEAEKANHAKTEFLATMNHELRTPMNAIIGFGQLLTSNSREPLTETQLKCVTHILNSGQHLLDLINQILSLSQIEAGHVALSMETVDLSSIAQESLSIVAPQASERTIDVKVSDLPKTLIRADRVRLKQVLLNLLSNAIKYNRDGGLVDLTLTLDSGLAVLAIRDTGQGIPIERQAELFQPFNRLGAEDSDIEGTGIGLSITRKLVTLMDGTIDFSSQQGQGSTFTVSFPLERFGSDKTALPGPDESAENSRSPASPEHPQSPAPTGRSSSRGKVLYIEEDPSNLAVMELVVGRYEGLELLTAHEPELGAQLARQEHPNLIFLNADLPGLHSSSALLNLADDGKTRAIPVIALCESPDSLPQQTASAVQLLNKPLDVDEVTRAINEYVKGTSL
ncbi:PAS domain-containing protein [Rhodovibrionaceae bacterium A322]